MHKARRITPAGFFINSLRYFLTHASQKNRAAEPMGNEWFRAVSHLLTAYSLTPMAKRRDLIHLTGVTLRLWSLLRRNAALLVFMCAKAYRNQPDTDDIASMACNLHGAIVE
jgi:hypothetical protein